MLLEAMRHAHKRAANDLTSAAARTPVWTNFMPNSARKWCSCADGSAHRVGFNGCFPAWQSWTRPSAQVTAAKPVHVLDGTHHSQAFLDGRRHFPIPQQHVEDVVVDVVVVREPVYPP